jgi:hypothetical protein
LKSEGDAQAGANPDRSGRLQNYYQVDQGSVVVIPRELGIGASEKPEKYIFTVLNKSQIVQAEPLEADHGMHPVAVAEPYSMGYGFGQPGISDYIGPLQDMISWLINSHIFNVRSALNNMFVVDPSMIEMQDVRNPEPGKIMRLKRAAFGQDVRAALTQLPVADVTGTHMKDVEGFMRFTQQITAVADNIMGIQDQGGRKTATEVRTSGESAVSRLAAQARIISAQGLVDLTEQMTGNLQQRLSDEFYLELLGDDALKGPMRVGPEQLSGDFHFPVHDGTLPLDKVAMLDVWKEIFLAVAKDVQLRAAYSLPKIFEFTAELGGARNIEAMRLQVQPDRAVAQAAQAGNLVPTAEASLPVPQAG